MASQPSEIYPYSTLEKQKPIFRALGLDLDGFYIGTLNVSIHPKTFTMVNPEITFEKVPWTDLHPPETFSFSRCKVRYLGLEYSGWVYFPHPKTKMRNFQNPSVIEILAPLISGVQYGDEIKIELNNIEISIGE